MKRAILIMNNYISLATEVHMKAILTMLGSGSFSDIVVYASWCL